MATGTLRIGRSTTGRSGRVRQFIRALGARHDDAVDRRLRQLLDDERQWPLLARLSPFDRAHHLDVHDRLVAAGFTDPDLLRAALLHDTGKADWRGRVQIHHRILRVVLRRAAPAALSRLSARQSGVWHGLYLAENHAHLGARAAGEAGASRRCCMLIAAHEGDAGGVDHELAALIAADEGWLP